MADLSKIKLNGTEYNLKDAEARQLVSDLEDSIPEVPSVLSELVNDVGYITSYTETDPVFTASAAAGISSTDISNWNAKSDFSGSYNDLEDKPTIPNVPAWALESTKPTYTASEVGAVSTSDLNDYVKKSISLDNLENIVSQTTSYGTIDTVETKIGGQQKNTSSSFKGIRISTWYEQSVYKTNLDLTGRAITISADNSLTIGKTGVNTTIKGIITPTSNDMAANKKYVDDSVSGISIPTKTSDLTNDSGYITSYTETDPIFTASAAAGISSTDISNWNAKSDFSGSYNDLSNKPTIPNVTSTYDATSTDAMNGIAISGALSSCVPEAVTNEEVITMMAALGYAVPVTDENDDPLTNNDSQILG